MRLIVATCLQLVDSSFVTTMPEDRAGTRKVYKDHNLHVLFGVTLMAVLGVSSITPALPEIRDVFGVTSAQVGLLITIFTLPGVALTPVLGVLSDRRGRRKILIPALFLFGVAQGINLPNVFSLLNAHAPSENRGAFMATNGMSLRAGQTIGPLLMAATAGTLGLTGAYLAATALAFVALVLVITLLR
jgi:MFS family permease